MALVGNAIPVLAIRDALGWHLETYTSNGESFYSQVADFTVAFTTPRALKIAASGSIVGSKVSGELRTRTFQADDVRDFAWSSGPLSEEQQTSPNGTLVKVWWTDPITKAQADAMLAVGMSSIDSHSAAYGAYPYPEIDLVIGNFTRFGGMEYPQLVMSDPSAGVIVHELAHQWWFGLVGDDEYTEPWLDEAFASYATDVYYGQVSQCPPPNWPSDTARVTNSMGYWDDHPTEYGPVVYTIGSCALHELASILGLKKMASFMRDYAVDHTLGWSTTDAFKADAQAVADSLHNPVKLGSLWKTYRIDNVP
jgi:aminopeptidase N